MSTARVTPGSALPVISTREAEVLDALGEHLTNAEIAGKLFISVRTVESHVSSLLRKLQVRDRRALADVAARRHAAVGDPTALVPAQRSPGAAGAPTPVTSFIGRRSERLALGAALGEDRLVTAIGPGGVGKTRLAISVLADIARSYADGGWYVDLVPVTDAALVAPAIAAALGLGEQQGQSAEETVLAWLSRRHVLLVLDNCEHLLDGLVVLVERLLSGSAGLTVLATSRTRLLAPFERVFPVPGLSVRTEDGRTGDAVELFLARAVAAGHPVLAWDTPRVTALCEQLDGMALAIELAAARLASLGLDGLESGLTDSLQLLTGAHRVDDRHQSLRSTIDWSYRLLSDADRALLRRVSVFAAPFTVDAVSDVMDDWPPVDCGDMPHVLASLADQSLVVAAASARGTHYRVPETIRQYGAEQLDAAGETHQARSRHLLWCLLVAADLEPPCGDGTGRGVGAWRVEFDAVVDELRAALQWAAAEDELRGNAYQLAMRLAGLTFTRGRPAEAQRTYEQAARLAADDREAAEALRHAAGAAESRHVGEEALLLHRDAAEAWLRAGDPGGAACELARCSELMQRGPGLMAFTPLPGASLALLNRAWQLADDDPTAQARAMVAEAFHGNAYDPLTAELSERAVTLAQRAGDKLAECAAFDQMTSVHLARGELQAAAATALHRTRLIDSLQITAVSALEFSDSHNMAAETALAAGDLAAARELAERARALPFHREEGHLASSRLVVVAVIAGDLDEGLLLAEHFRDGWEQAGRPRAGNLSRAAYAAATLHGLRGDDATRAEWLEIVDALVTPGIWLGSIHFSEFFDALLWLHRGQAERASAVLAEPPEDFREWHNGMWRPWYAALWAEAAVLTRAEDASYRVDRARAMTTGNPVARALVDRADAIGSGDRHALLRAAAALAAGGCSYQWARALVLAGGSERAEGEDALAKMGTTPMAVPPARG